MKLIDILNMISKGELKEGTTIRDKEIGMKISEFVLGEKELNENRLNEEYELIEPDHFTDVGEMAEKIKELDNYDWQEGDYDYQIEVIYNKLNEVISVLNRRNEDVR